MVNGVDPAALRAEWETIFHATNGQPPVSEDGDILVNLANPRYQGPYRICHQKIPEKFIN